MSKPSLSCSQSAPRLVVGALACVTLACGLFVASCGPAAPPPSMVIVVIDTLRADHLGLYGYDVNPTSPNLDARASSAAVFQRAHSTAPWTLPSFGSLFTGQIPTRHSAGVRVEDMKEVVESGNRDEVVERRDKTIYRLDESLPTLASTLQDAGYRTAAIMNNAFLSPEFAIDRGFETYVYDSVQPERLASEATDLALEWLQGHEESGSDQPFLLVVHYFDPHTPYAAPEPFLGRFAGRYATAEFPIPIPYMPWLRYRIRDRVEGWQDLMALEQGLYDEEIAYTDSELERLLTALDERHFLDRGYLVLTSDHGEEFHDHGWVEHGHTVYEELIRVPLMIWGPDLLAGRYEVPVSLVDIMPTLLDVAGVPAPIEFQGDSLWPALLEGPAGRTASAIRFDRPMVAEFMLYGDEKKALIRWPWKLLVDIEDEAELLFDLDSDPLELAGAKLSDLDEAGRDRVLTMLAELQTMIVEAGADANAQGASLSQDTLERLRALGYIR